ncbi:hypothetical protein CLU79DRAFT_697710 [Phycomyces nitens]|nr:hypothetical protein CLU79DRAFT_697710 [Phycomyces nitens]
MAKSTAAGSKKNAQPAKVVKEEDVSQSSDSDDSSEFESASESPADIKVEDEGSDDSDSEESGSEGSNAEEEESDAEESSGEESDEESEGEVVIGTKRKAEDSEEPEDQPPAKKVTVEVVSKPLYGSEGATVWVGQLDWSATSEDVSNFFSKCGEVKDVRIRIDPDTGKSRGFCYVDFVSKKSKAAALKMDGSEFMGRNIRVDEATTATPRKNDENYGPKTDTVFIANLSHDLDEESVAMAFSKFGTIVGDVRLPTNRETGKIKGIGYVQFSTADEAEAAVKGMNGMSINGRPVRTDFSGGDDSARVNSRGDRGGRGGRGGRGDFRGGRGGRGGRGDFRGGRGGRGGRGDFRGGRGGGRGDFRGGRGRGGF